MYATTLYSILGSIFSIYISLFPIIPFIQVFKRKEKIDILHEKILFFQLTDKLLWCSVWILKKKFIPFINSLIGILITSFLIMLYFYLYYNRILVKALIRFFILFGIEFFIFLRLIMYGNISVISFFAMIFNLSILVITIEGIINVLKEKCYKLINIHFTIVNICCSLFWLFYGICINFIYQIIPNSLGLFFSLINCLSWIYFYKKRDKYKNKEEETVQIFPYKT